MSPKRALHDALFRERSTLYGLASNLSYLLTNENKAYYNTMNEMEVK